jgi:protein TonB
VSATVTCCDPLEHLVDRLRRERGVGGVSLVAALAAHVILAIALSSLAARASHAKAPSLVTEIVDVELPALPPPSSEPPVESPETPALSKPARTTMPRPAAAAPTVQAQAAAVLTSSPDPNGPVDLSDTFVVGSAVAYAGGTTSPNGTGASAVHGGGSPGDAGARNQPAPGSPAAGADRSRRAAIYGGGQWSCPFPAEADRDLTNQATVEIRVRVGADGTPRDVAVLQDPGHGFAREAQRCAVSKRWSPALDREGSPVESTVVVNVHFER